MSIVIYKDGEKIYSTGKFNPGGMGIVKESERADSIDRDLSKGFSDLAGKWESDGYTKNGKISSNQAGKVWYDTGKLINSIADRYHIFGSSDEFFYWQAIEHYIDSNRSNHFKNCSFLARLAWSDVVSVGNWSVWRDILDTKKMTEDERVLKWLVGKVKGRSLGHKEIRKITQPISRDLKNTDTSILSEEELIERLNGIETEI
jgi:hypothetical protein